MIRYRAGFKYQLAVEIAVTTPIRPAARIDAKFITLGTDGVLTIRPGYAWDGPSGPAVDTPAFMRASLVHDALYELMRMGLLDPDQRGLADEEMRKICLEDGMWPVRAWWVWRAVRRMAAGAADPGSRKPVLTAP